MLLVRLWVRFMQTHGKNFFKDMLKKNVLILGGSSDIGISIIKKFIKNDYLVMAHFNSNSKALLDLKKKNKNLNTIKKDFIELTSMNVKSFIKKERLDQFDTVINLIGFLDNCSFFNADLDQTILSLKINTLVPNLIIRENIKQMSKKKYGRILNCSSIGVKFGGGRFSYNYSLAKHLLEFIPIEIRELAKDNILINNLRVGVVETKLHKKIKNKNLKNRIKLIPINRAASVNEISEFIYNLSSEKNTYITGQVIAISGGE
jgi:3-oxoacyl-[acyl-carrier protein] reductase